MEFPEPVIESPSSRRRRSTRRRWARRSASGSLKRIPSFRVQRRPRERPDDHQGHGRAPPRDQGRHRMKRDLQGRLPTVGAPQVAYRETLSRRRSSRLHPQEADRRLGPVRPHQARVRAAAARLGLRASRTRSWAASVPKEYIPGVEKGLKALASTRRARRLPGDRLQGDAGRRRLPRRRLERAGVRDRRRAPRSRKRWRRPCPSCSSRSCGSRS